MDVSHCLFSLAIYIKQMHTVSNDSFVKIMIQFVLLNLSGAEEDKRNYG